MNTFFNMFIHFQLKNYSYTNHSKQKSIITNITENIFQEACIAKRYPLHFATFVFIILSYWGEPWPRGTVLTHQHAGGAGFESPRGQHIVQP